MGAPNTLERRRHGAGTCAWCGQGRRRLYEYGGDHRHGFCDLSCFGSYAGVETGRDRSYDYVERRGNPSRAGRKCPDCMGAGGFLLGMAGRGGIDLCRKCKGRGRLPARARLHCVCGRPARRGFTHTTGSCYRTPPSRRNPDEWGGSGDRMDRRPRTVRPLAVCNFGLCTRRADVVVKGRPACREHAAQVVRRNPSRRRSKSPRRSALTRSLAWSAATDAANRAMRARGRRAWSRADYNVAVRTFARLWPQSREGR